MKFDESKLEFVCDLSTGSKIYKQRNSTNRFTYHALEYGTYTLLYDQSLCSLEEISSIIKDCYNKEIK